MKTSNAVANNDAATVWDLASGIQQYDTPPMRMRDVLAAATLSILVALPGGAAASGGSSETQTLSPPEVRWSRCAGMVRVMVRAQPGTHLTDQLPLELRLRAGKALDLTWKEPVGPSPEKARIVLPLGRIERPDHRILSIRGAVCNDDASLCLPFHGEADLAIPGPMRGLLRVTAGKPAGVSPEPRRRPAPIRPTASTGQGPGLKWFDSSEPGQLELAFALAREQQLPLLVDVFAHWCPPCDRLRDEFLEQTRWQPLLQRFVLIAADADAQGSFALKERYQVGGYPTLLVLDPQGQAVDRIVGFPGAQQVGARLEAIAPSGRGPESAGSAAFAEARALTAQGQWAQAWKQVQQLLLSRPGSGIDQFELLSLAVEAARHQDEAELPQLAREAAEIAPSPGLAAALADQAADALTKMGAADEAASLTADFEARLSDMISTQDPIELSAAADGKGLSGRLSQQQGDRQRDLAAAAWYRASWASGDHSVRLYAEAALRSAAQVLPYDEAQHDKTGDEPVMLEIDLPADLLTAAMSPHLTAQPGAMHDLISSLAAAKMPEPAIALCKQMTVLFPDDFTWHYRLAGLHKEAGATQAAMTAARLAYHHSYGDNKLRAAGRLGSILYQAGKVKEARSLLESSLEQGAPAQDKVRTHRYRRSLQELLQTWHDEQRITPR